MLHNLHDTASPFPPETFVLADWRGEDQRLKMKLTASFTIEVSLLSRVARSLLAARGEGALPEAAGRPI